MRSMTVTAWLAAAMLGTACSHAQMVGAETQVAKVLISPQEENQLGLQVQQQLAQKDVKVVTDPRVVDYVQRVSNNVLQFAKKDRPEVTWHVYVIDDPKTVNAFATPGGYLYVYTGLLLAADNEAQIAGVMGHEAGHVVARHSARAMVDAMGLQAVTAMALGQNPNQVAAVAANLLAGGTMLAHSRGEETDADEYGVRYLADAGYDPNALIAFFQKLEQSEGKQPGFLKYLSDHPLTPDRITHLQQYIAEHHLTGSKEGSGELPGIQAKIKSGVSSTVMKPEAAPAPEGGARGQQPAPGQPPQS